MGYRLSLSSPLSSPLTAPAAALMIHATLLRAQGPHAAGRSAAQHPRSVPSSGTALQQAPVNQSARVLCVQMRTPGSGQGLWSPLHFRFARL